MKLKSNLLRFVYTLTIGVLATAQSEPAESPLKRLEKNGVLIEYLPDLESVAKQLQPWILEQIKKTPIDSSQNFKKLIDNQNKIIQFLTKELALKEPTRFMKEELPDMLKNFEAVGKSGSLINIRHIQLWKKEPLKQFLDGGGEIPGYEYTPGKDGENTLTMVQTTQISNNSQSEKTKSYLFPLILKSTDPKEYLAEAKTGIEKLIKTLSGMSTLSIGIFLNQSIEIAVKSSIQSPISLFNWFTSGVAGHLTPKILETYISKDAAEAFRQSMAIEPFIPISGKLHLVKWVGPGPKEKSPEIEQANRIRQAFATFEINKLVNDHGPDTLKKIFEQVHKIAPSASSKKTQEKLTGEDLASYLEQLMNAIEIATGENFRRRLLFYSQAK